MSSCVSGTLAHPGSGLAGQPNGRQGTSPVGNARRTHSRMPGHQDIIISGIPLILLNLLTNNKNNKLTHICFAYLLTNSC